MPGNLDSPIAVRHESRLGRWERAWQRPSRPLRTLISGYTGYRQRLATPAPHRGIPTATMPLVINFGPAQTISWSGGASGGRRATVHSFLAGPHDRHVTIEADEHHGIQIDLRPTAAFRLLGQPLHPLTDEIVDLSDALGPDATRLVADLAATTDWPSRFRQLDRFLLRRLADGHAPTPEVQRAWHQIVASRGTVRVDELARETGWSTRHLRQRMQVELGLPPKRLARLTRFEHATRLLTDPHATDLARVAAAAGYYDQAHLANEVRHYCGLSPSQLRANQLPDAGGVFDLDAAASTSTGAHP